MKKTGEIDIKLGLKIASQRTSFGLTRKELAEAIGITHQQLQKYERGLNRISVARLYDIAKVLHISPTKILDDGIGIQAISNDDDYRSLADIMKYINKIKDEKKVDAIRNLVKSLALSEVNSDTLVQ